MSDGVCDIISESEVVLRSLVSSFGRFSTSALI